MLLFIMDHNLENAYILHKEHAISQGQKQVMSQIESYYEIANWLCDLEFSLGCIAANFYSIDDLEFCLQCIAANFHSIDYNIHYLVWHLDSLWYKHIICRWKVVHYCLKCNYMYTYEDSYHS
jgi:hypothetical protein